MPTLRPNTTAGGATAVGGPPPITLSPEQHVVVDHRGRHLQVVACAGSGKTEAISHRVAALIAKDGVDPSAIVAFTFTERAAASLKARIGRRVAEAMGESFLDRLGPMFVGTIHGYCFRLLQDHVPNLGNRDVLDPNRLAGLLSREHKRLELAKLGARHWRPIMDFLRNVDVVENECLTAKALNGTAFGECYERYRKTLDRYHFLTFGQLITAAIEALEAPEIHAQVHGRLRHLIVDEYQDINPAQERLIQLLAQPPVTLCVVGDDDQAIYQWRGSDVANILQFKQRYRAVARQLSVNRRSRPRILSVANTFAKTIQPRLPKEMQHDRPASKPEVHGWSAETPECEAEMIADTIEALRAQGWAYRDIAVLYRSVRTSAPPLVTVMKERNIPFRCAGRTGLFLQPEASLLGRTYAWLCDNDWKDARYDQPGTVTIRDLVDGYDSLFGNGRKIPELRQHLLDWKQMVVSTDEQVNLVRDYYRLLRLVGAGDTDADTKEGAARLGCVARFSQILADFEHVTRRGRYVEEAGASVFRGGQDRGKWLYFKLFNYLQHYALDAYEDFEGEDTFNLDAVDILTVHQAKGLEWPVVFIPALVEGRFPSRRAGQAQEWLLSEKAFPKRSRQRYEGGDTEERRLLYVALTRARDVVYLSAFERKARAFRPSQYLLDVLGRAPKRQSRLPLPREVTPSGEEHAEPPTLSFSELAQYEQCPLRYRLSTSFGFQPQLVTELGYGKAIHHILRRLADFTRATGKLPTPAERARLFQDEFYLPFANRPAFEQLRKRAEALVGRYVADYRDDLHRVWETERPFELHLEGGIVNGRADVILDREGGVAGSLALVDYKTATDPHADDVYAFQLAIYAAAGRGEGMNVRAAYLHELADGRRRPVAVDDGRTSTAKVRANALMSGILQRKFAPKPARHKCTRCDVRAICRHADCGRHDY